MNFFIKVIIIVLLFLPIHSFARDSEFESIEFSKEDANVTDQLVSFTETIRKAKVIEIIDEKEATDLNNQKQMLQKIKLRGIDRDFNEEFLFDGIASNSTTKKLYGKGDKVLVSIQGEGDSRQVQIIDSLRTSPLVYYLILFVLITVCIARFKGLKAIVSLALTIAIVFLVIIPLIARGVDPLLVAVIFSIPILAITIYLTHGFNRQSHIALIGTFSGVLIVGILSLIFAKISHLSGFADEEVIYIAGLLKEKFNPYSLMLAGFVIGALGILDDVALTQVSTVSEIKKADPKLSNIEVYKRAMRVGVDHVSSVINTLFLAYAGASFALLLLFNYKQPPFENTFMVLNNEIVATEIIRTIVGSMGILLAIPITTFLASRYLRKNDSEFTYEI